MASKYAYDDFVEHHQKAVGDDDSQLPIASTAWTNIQWNLVINLDGDESPSQIISNVLEDEYNPCQRLTYFVW